MLSLLMKNIQPSTKKDIVSKFNNTPYIYILQVENESIFKIGCDTCNPQILSDYYCIDTCQNTLLQIKYVDNPLRVLHICGIIIQQYMFIKINNSNRQRWYNFNEEYDMIDLCNLIVEIDEKCVKKNVDENSVVYESISEKDKSDSEDSGDNNDIKSENENENDTDNDNIDIIECEEYPHKKQRVTYDLYQL